jgi:nucleotide-binding universal stress UspA family protein
MKKILIPVDETESKKALETAKEFALKFDSELIIVHVKRRFEVDATIPWNYDAVQNDDVKKAIHDYARNIVDKTADFFKGTGINVTTEILDGHIASEICDFAEKNGCDLILINSHGHNAVERFLIGGVTSRVVHHSKVPVLIVR